MGENDRFYALFDDDTEKEGFFPNEEDLEESQDDEESWFEDEDVDKNDKYYNRFDKTVGYRIKVTQNKKPTIEELKEIKDEYDIGCKKNDKIKKDHATVRMMEILDAYIHELIKKNYSSYEQKYGEELLQEAYLGMIEGLEKYEPERGKPTTWFKIYIQHRMNAFLDSQVHHTTPHFLSAMKQVQEVIDKKESQGKSYTILDLHLESGVPIKTIKKCINIKRGNNALPFESKSSITENLASGLRTPEEEALRNEEHEFLVGLIKEMLTREEQLCVLYYYGFITGKPENADAIAEVTGIQKQYVRRYINAGLDKLKNPVKRNHNFKKNKVSTARITTIGVSIMTKEERDQQIQELEVSLDYDDDE